MTQIFVLLRSLQLNFFNKPPPACGGHPLWKGGFLRAFAPSREILFWIASLRSQ